MKCVRARSSEALWAEASLRLNEAKKQAKKKAIRPRLFVSARMGRDRSA